MSSVDDDDDVQHFVHVLHQPLTCAHCDVDSPEHECASCGVYYCSNECYTQNWHAGHTLICTNGPSPPSTGRRTPPILRRRKEPTGVTILEYLDSLKAFAPVGETQFFDPKSLEFDQFTRGIGEVILATFTQTAFAYSDSDESLDALKSVRQSHNPRSEDGAPKKSEFTVDVQILESHIVGNVIITFPWIIRHFSSDKTKDQPILTPIVLEREKEEDLVILLRKAQDTRSELFRVNFKASVRREPPLLFRSSKSLSPSKSGAESSSDDDGDESLVERARATTLSFDGARNGAVYIVDRPLDLLTINDERLGQFASTVLNLGDADTLVRLEREGQVTRKPVARVPRKVSIGTGRKSSPLGRLSPGRSRRAESP